MFLSFIIPLYNCERFITQCLDSIYDAKLDTSTFEVIVVDDGSKDTSLELVERYAAKRDSLKIVNQQNAGASVARNRGLEEAKGSYVWFVDADDKVESKSVEELVKVLKQNGDVDLLCFNYFKDFQETPRPVNEFKWQNISGVEYLKRHYDLYLWNKIYSASLLKEKRFLNGTKNLEDFLFNLQIVPYLERIDCLDIYGYHYNQMNMGSTSRSLSQENLQKLSDDTVSIHQAVAKLADTTNDTEQKAVIMDMLRWSFAGYMYSLLRFYSAKFMLRQIELYERLGFYPIKLSSYPKANRFLFLANKKYLFVSLSYAYHLFKKAAL